MEGKDELEWNDENRRGPANWRIVGMHAAAAIAVFVAVVGAVHLNGLSSMRAWNETMAENVDRGSWAPLIGQNLSFIVDSVAVGDRDRLEFLSREFEGRIADYSRCDLREDGMVSLFDHGYCPGEGTSWRTVRVGNPTIVVIGPLRKSVLSASLVLLSPNPGARVDLKVSDDGDVVDGLWVDMQNRPLTGFSDGQFVAVRVTRQGFGR